MDMSCKKFDRNFLRSGGKVKKGGSFSLILMIRTTLPCLKGRCEPSERINPYLEHFGDVHNIPKVQFFGFRVDFCPHITLHDISGLYFIVHYSQIGVKV